AALGVSGEVGGVAGVGPVVLEVAGVGGHRVGEGAFGGAVGHVPQGHFHAGQLADDVQHAVALLGRLLVTRHPQAGRARVLLGVDEEVVIDLAVGPRHQLELGAAGVVAGLVDHVLVLVHQVALEAVLGDQVGALGADHAGLVAQGEALRAVLGRFLFPRDALGAVAAVRVEPAVLAAGGAVARLAADAGGRLDGGGLGPHSVAGDAHR